MNVSVATGCSEETGEEGNVEGLSSTSRNKQKYKKLSLKNNLSRLKAYEEELETEVRKGTLLFVTSKGCLVKKSLLMRSSSSSCRRHHIHSLLSWWGTSTILTSAGKIAQKSCRQSKRSLKGIEDNFLCQVVDNPKRVDAILELMVTNASELINDIKIWGSLSCIDHALVKFTDLWVTGWAKDKVRTLNFSKANFQLLKELVSGTPMETALRD